VQGVGFRYFTQGEAQRLDLSGYVRNLPERRVEAYAIGRGKIASFAPRSSVVRVLPVSAI